MGAYLICSQIVGMSDMELQFQCTFQCQAGGGLGIPREFECAVYPQGGDFDHLISQLQRAEEK